MTLLARAASGQTLKDDAAAYIDQLYRVAVSLTKSQADAEDLVQETYLRALDHGEQFSRGTNLKAWLTRILYNLFINRSHRERKSISMDHAREEGEPSLMDSMAASVPGPEVDSLRAELRENSRRL